MELSFGRKFKKQYAKLSPQIQDQFDQRLHLFVANPNHPLLRRHGLSGQWSSCSSINITGDVRAIFEIQPDGVCLFMAIGTHIQLYG